jgi:hypothetical protein
MSKKLTTYKGTDKDMKCHGGFQYELGKEYADDGAIRCGGSGFHSCKAPLDVFRYFAPNKSRYFACLAGGTVDEDTADSKIASSELALKAEIGIPGLVKAHIEYVKAHTTTEYTDPKQATAGYGGAATAGNCGAATAGYGGAATAGNCGAATAGDSGAATAGDSGAATAGNCGAATTGDSGAATAGDYGAATSRGTVTVGECGAGLVQGNGVKIRGGLGAILVIAEEEENSYDLAHWKAVVVDGETVKADTWYKLMNGELVEAEQC